MSTFDSSHYDVPTLIAKLHDQRFDGYDSESLAVEVEKFRNGTGTAAMSEAVDALKQIAGALSNTDTTLREQLGKLGVSWQSNAGGQASAVMTEQAGFSADANTKVAAAAQLIFQQGEAFSRTKNKLPDPSALRHGEDGFSFSDTLFSLFGFETDHASSVKANIEAKAQAVDALNAYAHDSGDYLASSQPVDGPPQSMNLMSSPGAAVQSVAGPTIDPVPPLPDVPDTSPTVAAGAKDAPVHQAPISAPAPRVATTAGVPTPPLGVASVTPHQTNYDYNAPSQATTSSSATTSHRTVTEPLTGSTRQPSSQPDTYGRTGSGPAPLGQVPVTPGQQAPGVGTTPGGGPGATPGAGDPKSSSAWGKPGNTGGGIPADGLSRAPQGGAEAVLGKGKSVGAVPGATSGTANVGPGFTNIRAAGGVGALADGSPAMGAAAMGGVTSGENEHDRQRRGGGSKGLRQQLPIGDMPEDEGGKIARKGAPEPPSTARTRSILEPAATQDGEEDGEHVRRYGVDDRDLFTDQREVSVDLIGGKRLPEE